MIRQKPEDMSRPVEKEESKMLVNKSGRRLVIGRINVKNGETFPGIPFTASERKSIEKFIAKGYIAEVAEKKVDPIVEEVKVEAPKAKEVKAEAPKVEKAVEEKKSESVAEEPKSEPVVEEAKAEEPKPEPAYVKYSRRRKKAAEAEAEAEVKEDGVGSNG